MLPQSSMSVSQRVALAALRAVWAECNADPGLNKPSLRLRLESRAFSSVETVLVGGIKSTSGSGRNVTFDNGQGGGPRQDQIVEMWTYLVELFDRAQASLGGTATDEAVVIRMKLYLRPVKGSLNDWRHLIR